jgi:acetylornithine deacetylase/succinyl-diaminopimelate desuccinylase-like protein
VLIREDQLVAWLAELVRRPSEQSDRMESDPAVQSFIAECVQPLLEREGLPGRRDAMGNLIVEIGPADAPRSAMLLAYGMTHPASGMREPFKGELLGTGAQRAVRGRGVAEQKGALAAAIGAFTAAAKQPLDARLILAVSTAGETGQHKAAEAILASLDRTPELALVAIGTSGRVSLANKGRVDVHIEIEGRSSHSSTPWLGVDAILGARAVMERLAALDLGRADHPLLGGATLTPTAIHSFPGATHTIQSLVRMTYDRRLLPGQDPEPALRAIEDALRGMAPWTVRVRAGALQYPAEISADGALMRCVLAGARRMGLPPPGTFALHGCVDTGILLRRGCEAAMWGPGDPAMWHTDEEQLPVEALLSAAAGYLGFLLEFSSPSVR